MQEEMAKLGSGVIKQDMRYVTMLLCYHGLKDTDTAGLLQEEFEAHRKLMRYKQWAFSLRRKKSPAEKQQNELTIFGVR